MLDEEEGTQEADEVNTTFKECAYDLHFLPKEGTCCLSLLDFASNSSSHAHAARGQKYWRRWNHGFHYWCGKESFTWGKFAAAKVAMELAWWEVDGLLIAVSHYSFCTCKFQIGMHVFQLKSWCKIACKSSFSWRNFFVVAKFCHGGVKDEHDTHLCCSNVFWFSS